ncbi:MAG: hypothetical protein ABEJ75_01130 [Candidatus Nanohaloarchaea archaeon]
MSFAFTGKTKEDRLWDELERAEEVTDLELEPFVDDVEIDPSLPEHTPAVTKYSRDPAYSETVFAVNPGFLYLDQSERRHFTVHEGGHVLAVNDQLTEQLSDRKGVSRDFVRAVEQVKRENDRPTVEGLNQAITRRLDPFPGNYVYPHETAEVERWLEEEGIDIDSELSGETGETPGETADAYTEIYGVESGDGFYFQELKDIDYSPASGEDPGYRREALGVPGAQDYLGEYEEGEGPRSLSAPL